MSMFSIPDELMPSGAMLDEMMKETKALMPAEFAGTVNLMAHPLAGMAAMSALGLGFASHAAGVWFGALSGATVASQRLLSSAFDDYAASADEFRDTSRSPRTRAKAAASALIAEAGAASPAVQESSTPKPAVGKLEKVLRIVDTPPKADAVPEAAPKPPKTVSRKAAKPAVSTPNVLPIADVEPAAKSEPHAVKVEPVFDEAVPVAAEASKIVVAPALSETAAVESETAPVQAEAAPVVSEVPPLVAETSPRKPAAIDKPAIPDDLKAISGVGPKLEQVLNGLGVWTYAQVAAWGRDEVAWVDDTLGFKGRIERDGWIGQAATLAEAKG